MQKRIRRAALGSLLLPCLGGSLAWAGDATRPGSVLSDDNHRITYNTCEEDASGECASHALFCGPDGFGLVVMGTGEEGRDTRALAQGAITAPWGEASLRFRLGGSSADVPVASVQVELNEMNADWDVTLKSYDASSFFSVLTKKTARGAAIEVGGRAFPLAPRQADEAHLLAFKKACGE